MPPQDTRGATAEIDIQARTMPHGKDKRRFPAGSNRLVMSHVPCLATVAFSSRVGKGVEEAAVAPEVTSSIVDQSNRKSLLSFMVHIRQHLSIALTSRLSAFLPRTGTGKQGRAARFVPNPRVARKLGHAGAIVDR